MPSVETVLGPVSPQSLGRTLTHEHFLLDFNAFYTTPPTLFKSKFPDNITLKNVGILRQYPYSSRYNVTFNDEDSEKALLNDVHAYKAFGGGTIVENTSIGLKRDLTFMKKVSKATGVHVVAGTGYYVAAVQPESTLNKTLEEMHDEMMAELVTGVGDSKDTIKCGFIGEVGSAWPIHDFEKRAIKATAAVQESLKCAVSFHPGRDPTAPFEIMRLYLEAGGDVKKAVMSHLDRTLIKSEDLFEFDKLGCYCQFDLFGTECSFYQLSPMTDMPSDAERVNKILELLKYGNTERILMSHDVHTKHRLEDFGGHGFSHIFNNVFPKMKIRGIDQSTIDQITIQNPQKWLEK